MPPGCQEVRCGEIAASRPMGYYNMKTGKRRVKSRFLSDQLLVFDAAFLLIFVPMMIEGTGMDVLE